MKEIKFTAQYRRDLKRLQRQGKEFDAMRRVIQLLEKSIPIPPEFYDHALKGKWKGRRELHLESDWLLIYRTTDEAIYLERTGSHSELLNR